MTKDTKRYLLIMPNEDGEPNIWLDDHEVGDIKKLKEDYGIEEFLKEVPKESEMYWKSNQAMLLEVEIKSVKPVKVVEEYELT